MLALNVYKLGVGRDCCELELWCGWWRLRRRGQGLRFGVGEVGGLEDGCSALCTLMQELFASTLKTFKY